jgi:glycosyltransferase involved in cell wall biosynthesis
MSSGTTANPTLSVTVLNYNYGHYLEACLQAIVDQRFRDFELIVINDCSTDNSIEVLTPFLADPRIRLIDHATNQGFVKSLREGMAESRGELISVISADDLVVDPGAFGRQVELAQAHPEVTMVYSAYLLDNCDDHPVVATRPADATEVEPPAPATARFMAGFLPMHSGVVLRRAAYEAVGGYDDRYRWALDRQIFLDLALAGPVGFVDEPLYLYRRHPGSMSKQSSGYEAMFREVIDLHTAKLAVARDRFPDEDWDRIEERARAKALTSFLSDHAYSGRRREAMKSMVAACRIDARTTLSQRATAAAAIRVVLGSRAANWARRRVASRPEAPSVVNAELQ